MYHPIKYSAVHALFREEARIHPDGMEFRRYIGSWTLSKIDLNWQQVESFRLVPHEQFRPLGKVKEGPDHLLFVFYRTKPGKTLKKLGLYVSLDTKEGRDFVDFLENALGHTRALAPKVMPFRYYILFLILLWILELTVLIKFFGFTNMPANILILWLTYVLAEKKYFGT